MTSHQKRSLMRFKEKSIQICCEWEKCYNGHVMFHLSKTIQICKKLALHSNLVIKQSENDTLITNSDDYLVKNKRFVK